MMLQLPTGVSASGGPITASFTVSWTGPPHPQGTVAYRLVHQPAASISLSNGWWGTDVSQCVCI